MADKPSGGLAEARKPWWQRPLLLSGLLLLVAVACGVLAYVFYEVREPSSFKSLLAQDVLLNGVVVASLGAALAAVVAAETQRREYREALAQRKFELFLRTREAHVLAVQARRILRARDDLDIYHEQMRVLLGVIQDLGEVREEVKISDKLFTGDDEKSIRMGLGIMIDYLQTGAHRVHHLVPRRP